MVAPKNRVGVQGSGIGWPHVTAGRAPDATGIAACPDRRIAPVLVPAPAPRCSPIALLIPTASQAPRAGLQQRTRTADTLASTRAHAPRRYWTAPIPLPAEVGPLVRTSLFLGKRPKAGIPIQQSPCFAAKLPTPENCYSRTVHLKPLNPEP